MFWASLAHDLSKACSTKSMAKVLRRLAQTTTKLIVLQDLCYLGFLCGPKKEKPIQNASCPLGLCISRVPGSVLFLVFSAYLNMGVWHPSIACTFVMHLCCAFFYSNLIPYYTLSVFDFFGDQFCEIAKVAISHQTIQSSLHIIKTL